MSDHRIEQKIEEYFEGTKAQPNTLMIRELRNDFEAAKKEIDNSHEFKRQVKSYWYSVYQKFLDIREQRILNFAIKRWAVDGLSKPVEKVLIDSFSEDNEIFKCKPEYSEKKNMDE